MNATEKMSETMKTENAVLLGALSGFADEICRRPSDRYDYRAADGYNRLASRYDRFLEELHAELSVSQEDGSDTIYWDVVDSLIGIRGSIPHCPDAGAWSMFRVHWNDWLAVLAVFPPNVDLVRFIREEAKR